MSLLILIGILLFGGLLAWWSERWGEHWPRYLSLLALSIACIQLFALCNNKAVELWWYYDSMPWIARFGIHLEVGLDGLSAMLLWLTLLLGIFSVLASWSEVKERVGFFHFNLLAILAGVAGVFVALDLFLFFVFWEVMLLPMVVLIAVWGHESRVYAAVKFFLFTQASSLLLLLAIIVLAWLNFLATNQWSFSYTVLLNTPLSETAAWWCMLGFFIAFVVKLPSVPFHTWLPDAHTQAPTAGSIILAAILLKTGAYGLIRFTVPLFPEASQQLAPFAMTLAVISILYGGKLAFAQNDMKRLVAYSSVSHMGFVLLGIYTFNTLALQGAVLQMIAHGLSTAALFAIAGMMQERLHSRDMNSMGGLWQSWPRLGSLMLFFAVASLGLPGLANFVAEFLVLLGVFAVSPWLAAVSALGLIIAVVYSLILIQKTFWGEGRGDGRDESRDKGNTDHRPVTADANRREFFGLAVLVLSLIYFGLQPQSLLNASTASINQLLQRVQSINSAPRIQVSTPALPAVTLAKNGEGRQ